MDINTLIQTGISMISDAIEIDSSSTNNVDEAIAICEKRLEELKNIKKEGFSYLSDYKEYKKAQEIVAKHQKKN